MAAKFSARDLYEADPLDDWSEQIDRPLLVKN